MIAEYEYNLWGERIKKVDYSQTEPRITYYLYEAKRLVAEANAEGEITRQYIYGRYHQIINERAKIKQLTLRKRRCENLKLCA